MHRRSSTSAPFLRYCHPDDCSRPWQREKKTDRDGNESASKTYSIGCQLVAAAAAAAVLSSTTSSPGQHGNNDTNIYRFLFAVSLLFLLNALTTLRVVSRSLALSVCLSARCKCAPDEGNIHSCNRNEYLFFFLSCCSFSTCLRICQRARSRTTRSVSLYRK